ncbi:MAG: DUF4747 family protein [Paludibacter sp.]|nr:DUF4747 family protein [Paludibacter sp.]
MKNKRSREKDFKIGILNIKVAPKDEEIDSAAFYTDILKRVFENDIACNTRGEKYMEFRSMNITEDKKIVYGKLMYYTVLDPNDWYNRDSKTMQKVEIDSSLNPNAKEGDYFFIPDAHRFCFTIKSNGIAISQVEIFMKYALEKIADKFQTVFVTRELREDVIERILSAGSLSKLDIDISYTNNDLSDDFEKLLDDDLKDGHVRNLHLEAKSFSKESINLSQSKVLSAALKLSQSNGYAEATIKERGKNVVVSTTEYPRNEQISTQEGKEHIAVFEKIMSIFRNGLQK